MVVSFLPSRVMGLTGSTAAVGYITSAYAISNMAIHIPMGVLADKLGYKRFLVAGYLLCAVSGILFYLSRDGGLLFLGRVVQGVGEAPLWAIAPALLSILYPNAKGKMIGFYNASLHVGLTLGPLLGILVLGFFGSGADNFAFIFFSCVCVAAALTVAVSVENPERKGDLPGEKIDLGKMLILLSDRTILCVLFGITLYGAGYAVALTSIPAYMLSYKGYSQTYVQVLFTVFYLAICISQLTTGHLSDKLGRERFMVAGFAAAAILIAAFPLIGPIGAMAALWAASIGLGTFSLSSMAYLNNAVPDNLKGTISGTYFLFWGIGYFSGPMIAGHLGELGGIGIIAGLPQGSLGFYCYCLLLTAQSTAMGLLFRKSAR